MFFLFLNSQKSPHQVTAVIDSISDYSLDPGRFSVSTIRPLWAMLVFSWLQNNGPVYTYVLINKQQLLLSSWNKKSKPLHVEY